MRKAAVQDHRVKTFLTVCRTLNYTRAGEELSLTQPAVTQHIGYLERAYGAKLFEYRHRKLELTAAGLALYHGLSVMAHDEALLRDRVKAAACGTAVSLRIGMTLTAGEYLVAAPLARCLANRPDVHATVRSGSTTQLLRQLQNGLIDCAFVEGFYDSAAFKGDTFCTEPFVGVCAGTHRFATTPNTFDDLLDETLVVREPGSGSREVLEHLLAGSNLSLSSFANVCEVESLDVIKVFVAQDLGISFMYQAATQRECEEGSLRTIQLKGKKATHDVSFVRLHGSAFEDEMARLFEDVRQMRL